MFGLREMIMGIPLDKILANSEKLDPARLRIGATVTAGKSLPTTLSVSDKGQAFLVLSFTGSFTTLQGNGPTDDGVCRMSMKLKNGSRVYIPDPVFLHNLFTPGRVKSAKDTAGAVGNQLQFPGEPWIAVWRPKDAIEHTVQNDATADNDWEACYYGIWLK